MESFNPYGEQVIRHRGAKRDENGQLVEAASNVPLTPIAIAPGGGSEFAERGRDGESIKFSVYFEPGTDIKNDDEMTVRDERFGIVVDDWRHPDGGLEVLCTRGQG